LDIYDVFEPTRRLLTPVPEKVTFFNSRELPNFARTLAFGRLRGKSDPEAPEGFAQPISQPTIQRSKSLASYHQLLGLTEIAQNDGSGVGNAHRQNQGI
jgi:hypothetical protein